MVRDSYKARRGKSVPAPGEWTTYGSCSWGQRLERSGNTRVRSGRNSEVRPEPAFQHKLPAKTGTKHYRIAGLLEVRTAVFRIDFVGRNTFHCSVLGSEKLRIDRRLNIR